MERTVAKHTHLKAVGHLIIAEARLLHSSKNDLRAQPGMPVPSGLTVVLALKPPDDANPFERLRDEVLWLFAHPRVHRLFLTLSVCVCLAVVLNGLLTGWSVLGLYLGVENGMGIYFPECVALAQLFNQSLHPLYIPKPPNAEWGWSHYAEAHACTDNQFYFNLTLKIYVGLFSYINFLPIPWRLAILHHVTWNTCHQRPRAYDVGHDFYGARDSTRLSVWLAD